MIDIKYEKCFFGEKGITSTSANYLCNIAKEALDESQQFFENLSFHSTDLCLIGSPSRNRVRKSISQDEFDSIAKRIKGMCAYNSFIAWFREAIKEKDRLLTIMKTMDFDDYVNIFNIDLQRPVKPQDYDSDDAYRDLTVGQRFLYIKEEACASTYGQIIHPMRPLSQARRRLSQLANNPVEVKGEGVNTLIYENNLDYSLDKVNDLFFELQDTYRTFEKALNNTKHVIKEKVYNENTKIMVDYKNELEKYETRRSELYATFKEWKENQINEIHALKIIIPDSLKPLYDKLNKMGKAEKA